MGVQLAQVHASAGVYLDRRPGFALRGDINAYLYLSLVCYASDKLVMQFNVTSIEGIGLVCTMTCWSRNSKYSLAQG
eukprot:10701027-Heterocapsa_arctica.AAC.1